MKASIVVPIYNGKRFLHACLLSLNHQRLESGDDFEVVVVDDGSTDGTGELVASLQVAYSLKYVFKERTATSSRSAARNVGIAAAANEVLIFMDGDHLASPAFVSEHLRAHKHRADLAVIGFRKYLREGDVDISSLRKAFSETCFPSVESDDERNEIVEYYSENINNTATPWFLFWTSNVSVRKEHIERIHGFDEDFIVWSLEDQELGYRLYKENLTFVFNKKAIVFHQHHPKNKSMKRENWATNYQLMKHKHPNPEILMVEAMGWLRVHKRDELSWLECYRRFDQAVHILQGGNPCRQAPLRVVELAEKDLQAGDIPSQLRELASRCHVVVFDYSSDSDLDLIVQLIRPRFALLYYRNPDMSKKCAVYEHCLRCWAAFPSAD